MKSSESFSLRWRLWKTYLLCAPRPLIFNMLRRFMGKPYLMEALGFVLGRKMHIVC